MSHEAIMWFAPLGFGALVVSALALVWRRLRPPTRRVLRGEEIVVETLDLRAALPEGAREATTYFRALVPHFVAVARRTGNRVWIARAGSDVVGLAIEDRVGVSSIFAPSADVCEAIRVAMGIEDFFAEERHGNLESVIEATERTSTKLPAAVAYNVLETYDVLERTDGDAPVYDSQIVTRLESGDQGAAAELLTTVLRVSCGESLAASLAEGDLAYVARVDGTIVGVGLATIVGDEGRLHTLVVDPRHRDAGLGRELVRARVRAMQTLGVRRIITEIPTRSAAALENVRREGFRPIGSMYVETSQSQAPASSEPRVRR